MIKSISEANDVPTDLYVDDNLSICNRINRRATSVFGVVVFFDKILLSDLTT